MAATEIKTEVKQENTVEVKTEQVKQEIKCEELAKQLPTPKLPKAEKQEDERDDDLAQYGITRLDPSQTGSATDKSSLSSSSSASTSSSETKSIGLCMKSMHWGILSSNIPDDEMAKKWASNMINARSESVFEKRSFKQSILMRRCLVFVNGYYEWKQLPGNKREAFFIKPETATKPGKELLDGRLLCLAGIYDIRNNGQHSFAVLTQDPTGTPLIKVHDRMPVMFTTLEEMMEWINPENNNNTAKIAKMISSNTGKNKFALSYYQVSDFVNSHKNNSSRCIEPLESIRNKEGLMRFFNKPAVKKEESVKVEEEPNPSSSSASKLPLATVKKEETSQKKRIRESSSQSSAPSTKKQRTLPF